VPLATALCKTFLLRMLNDSRAGRNPTRVVVPIEEEEDEFYHIYIYSCLSWMNQLFEKAILPLGPVSSGYMSVHCH
jgi:hypothetical protein